MRHLLFKSREFLESHVHLPTLPDLAPVTTAREAALITGATGFIGGYLLIELLRRNAFEKYYCLVRGATAEIRLRKLKHSLANKGLSYSEVCHRLVIVPGDISRPRLGLAEQDYRALAASVDHVFHFAGTMNWVAGFGAETVLNIAALRDVICFAAAKKTKYVHYASSMGAWSLLAHRTARISEAVLHDRPDLLPGGYCQLKWINEKICHLGQAAGIPICIYRIGDVKGHSETGHSDPRNFGNLLLLQMMLTGTVPDCDTQFNFLPVDYLAQAIACIATNAPYHRGRTFQFSNSEMLTMDMLVDVMTVAGFALHRQSPADWYAALSGKRPLGKALRPVFRSFVPETGQAPVSFFEIGSELYRRKHDCRNTEWAVASEGLCCPAMVGDGTLLRYVAALTGRLSPA